VVNPVARTDPKTTIAGMRIQTAQVFLIDTWCGFRRMLIVPKATLDDADIGLLCNAHLAEMLKVPRESRVTLTPQGPVVGA
jgi:hypothetical protein